LTPVDELKTKALRPALTVLGVRQPTQFISFRIRRLSDEQLLVYEEDLGHGCELRAIKGRTQVLHRLQAMGAEQTPSQRGMAVALRGMGPRLATEASLKVHYDPINARGLGRRFFSTLCGRTRRGLGVVGQSHVECSPWGNDAMHNRGLYEKDAKVTRLCRCGLRGHMSQ